MDYSWAQVSETQVFDFTLRNSLQRVLCAYFQIQLQELGLIRKPSSFMSSICDERGAELLYAGVPITKIFEVGLLYILNYHKMTSS